MRLTKERLDDLRVTYRGNVCGYTKGEPPEGDARIRVGELIDTIDALEAELAALTQERDEARKALAGLDNLVNEVNELNEIAEALYSTNALRGRQIAKIADKILNAMKDGKVGDDVRPSGTVGADPSVQIPPPNPK